jgi:mono/diheme cytochrome c family protein
MRRLKLAVVLAAGSAAIWACAAGGPRRLLIEDNRSYEASLFRQHCAVCHGKEGDGRTLDDGKVVPSLREGQFKAVLREQIYAQIANGGNGMTPFRGQLTERELQLMTDLVYRDLRGNK